MRSLYVLAAFFLSALAAHAGAIEGRVLFVLPEARSLEVELTRAAEDSQQEAAAGRCHSIAYTYTEPTIFFEYAHDTAMLARERGLRNIFVTNGYMTDRTVEAAAPWLDAANIDLKSWQEKYYRESCMGRLKPVLKTIRKMKEMGIWVEITTLLIPGENDFPEDLQGIASFIADLDVDIPWHISAFHPSYQYMDRRPAEIGSLEEARRIGLEAGLRYIYLGNVPADNDTICPNCGKAVIERRGRLIGQAGLEEDGQCGACRTTIAGVWK